MMITPAMDLTGVTGESSRSAETSPRSSAPPEVNKLNSKSPRLSALPPYFRSYEAYIEHCVAQVGREEIPETAFDRLCASCEAVFKKIAEMIAGGETQGEVAFCTVNEFLRSAAEGDCHVCHGLMANILRRRGDATDTRFSARSLESGVDWLERGDAALAFLIRCDFLYMRVGNGDDVKEQFEWFITSTKVKDEKFARDHSLPTALTTAGNASWNQALKWIENCRTHPLCNMVPTANVQDKWPARLVAVGVTGDAHVRICETSRPGFVEEPYMTLSHCWGKKEVSTQLSKETYATFLDGIQLGELPKTFRDAIEVTRKLKIPFIWIDSLCIIQNSYEDWIQESAKMQQVYQNSFLNLAAGASADPNGGLFYQRYPLSVVPWSIRIGEDQYLMAQYINEYTAQSYESTPLILYTRGWVLQEQLLVRRTLIFGQKELHWECSTYQASESFPDFLDRPEKFPWNWEKISRPEWQNLLRGKLVDSELQAEWNHLLGTYFKRSLTKPSDRLVAISGLAEQLSNRWSGIAYLAGLWSYRLIQGLLWSCEPPCSQRDAEIAPSWSWASLIQPCQSGKPSELSTGSSQTVDNLAEVLKASTTPKSRTNPFGPIVFGGSIKLRSPVLRVRATAVTELYTEYYLEHGDDCYSILDLDSHFTEWDDINDAKTDIQDAYLVPFVSEVAGFDDVAFLSGLILLKTADQSCKMQFRRAGNFRFSDNFLADDFFDKHIDDDSVNGIGDSHNRSSQDRIDNNTEDAVLENQDNLSDGGIDAVQSIHQELKKRGLFRDIDSWFAEKVGDGLEERMDYLKKDPYANGPPLNTTLENRYHTESGIIVLPEISRFLETIAWVAKNNKANGTPDPVLGFGEGNGYYTYEIV